AVQLADGVAGLQVAEPKAREDVAPADYQDGQVDQVEQEWQRGRKGGHKHDAADDEQLQATDHASESLRRTAMVGRLGRCVGNDRARRCAAPDRSRAVEGSRATLAGW